jgi:hypothetical protein
MTASRRNSPGSDATQTSSSTQTTESLSPDRNSSESDAAQTSSSAQTTDSTSSLSSLRFVSEFRKPDFMVFFNYEGKEGEESEVEKDEDGDRGIILARAIA